MKGGYFFFQGKNPFDVGNALFKTCRSCQCENVFVKTNGLMKGKKGEHLATKKMAQQSPYVEAVAEEEAKLERMSAALGSFFFKYNFIFVLLSTSSLSSQYVGP